MSSQANRLPPLNLNSPKSPSSHSSDNLQEPDPSINLNARERRRMRNQNRSSSQISDNSNGQNGINRKLSNGIVNDAFSPEESPIQKRSVINLYFSSS